MTTAAAFSQFKTRYWQHFNPGCAHAGDSVSIALKANHHAGF